MINLEEIRTNYKNYPNWQIEKIAINESKSLKKEVLQILKKEIDNRNLDKKLIKWVDAENATFTVTEKNILIDKIEKLPCPNCGQKHHKLGGFEFKRVVSLILFYSSSIERRIMCFDCGKQKKKNSILLILLSGWWSLKGLFFTPFIIISELIKLSSLEDKSSEILNVFLETNTGKIRLHGDKPDYLTKLINIHNNDYKV